jgi:hypothetical protein
MTPKEKAEELFEKFNNPDTTHCPYVHNAQQCALIAVDEIIKIEPYQRRFRLFDEVRFNNQTRYWEEVKQEINNL